MEDDKILAYIKKVLDDLPDDWLKLTTHRLDLYNEKLAKVEFLEQFEILYNDNNADTAALNQLPTAFDYIRLGHPLSCILEWVMAKLNNLNPNNVISFSSKSMPVLAILRKNLLADKNTQIIYTGELPAFFKTEILKAVYGYKFELKQVEKIDEISTFDGSTIFISQQDASISVDERLTNIKLSPNIDFFISVHEHLGSFVLLNGAHSKSYMSEIQHVRRRETIAMTPTDCLAVLIALTEQSSFEHKNDNVASNKALVLDYIKEITAADTKAIVGSSGLSIQYAILMGLIHDAAINHKGKAIKIIVPPNCYGGTNDQARRVAACVKHVEVVDLLVDGDNDMVQSVNTILAKVANEDAVPYIIAEIPTNPRVEVPDLIKLKEALSKPRKTATGETAIDPVFILDQTFCPNVNFLGKNETLSTIRTIAYISGSKFPSGGRCNAGFCIANNKAAALIEKIELHLTICDNEATDLQYEILARQLPSMKQRIQDAYKNTRAFVNFIKEALPTAKINFVSEELASQGFTPSVFSLDLPTKGNTEEERESYKRALNHKLIKLMISKIPNESKHCVSYGQLRGCYWTIPATSTQGTTKEGDKDYIARVALSPDLDLELHKKVFLEFVGGI